MARKNPATRDKRRGRAPKFRVVNIGKRIIRCLIEDGDNKDGSE